MRVSARFVTAASIVVFALTALACQGDSAQDKAGSVDGQVGAPPPAPPVMNEAAADMSDAGARRMAAMERATAAQTGAAMGSMAAPEQPPRSDALPGVGQYNAGASTMLIRTGQAFIEVEQLDPAVLKVRQFAAQVGGFIANSSIVGGRDQLRQATFEIKIPSTRYDEAVGSLSSIGKVETVSSNSQDVGEEFVDITARVTNAKRLEERLISLLANRTGKLDEVLRVERELARVREEIERYEGRLRYLSSRVAMSTLTITIHEPGPIFGNNPGENPIAAALRRAWRNFVGLIAGSIAALGILIPLAALGALAWIGYRRWRRSGSVS